MTQIFFILKLRSHFDAHKPTEMIKEVVIFQHVPNENAGHIYELKCPGRYRGQLLSLV